MTGELVPFFHVFYRFVLILSNSPQEYPARAFYYNNLYGRHQSSVGYMFYARGVLHYFDDGEQHPHAIKPYLSAKAKRHLKRMLAKRQGARE